MTVRLEHANLCVHDIDGVSNAKHPIRLQLIVVKDEAPLVEGRLAGIGSAITPGARLPVRGKIEDDHALVRTWFEWKISGTKSGERDVKLPAGGELSDEADVALAQLESSGRRRWCDVRRLGVDRRSFRCRDRRNVGRQPGGFRRHLPVGLRTRQAGISVLRRRLSARRGGGAL